MDDEAHISLIDPHPEGIRGDHDTYLITHPTSLTVLTLLIGQTCVVVGSTYSYGIQLLCYLTCHIPIAAVDDRRSLYSTEDMAHHSRLVIVAAYGVGEVRAGEALLE